jgi:hypothetical protein
MAADSQACGFCYVTDQFAKVFASGRECNRAEAGTMANRIVSVGLITCGLGLLGWGTSEYMVAEGGLIVDGTLEREVAGRAGEVLEMVFRFRNPGCRVSRIIGFSGC